MVNDNLSLTTGDIAKHCSVNLRTVIRWLEAGKLKGYKLPGRGNNRVLLKDFLIFLRQHNMPIPEEYKSQHEPLVLIVDDEPQMAKAIERVARKAGFKTIIANGGFQAGLIVSSQKPALMTLDLSMPGVDGFDVITHTRAQKELDDLKIIVISALSESERQRAVDLGANMSLAKPFEPKDLTEALHTLLKEKGGA